MNWATPSSLREASAKATPTIFSPVPVEELVVLIEIMIGGVVKSSEYENNRSSICWRLPGDAYMQCEEIALLE